MNPIKASRRTAKARAEQIEYQGRNALKFESSGKPS